jgi:hypothetical protein
MERNANKNSKNPHKTSHILHNLCYLSVGNKLTRLQMLNTRIYEAVFQDFGEWGVYIQELAFI